jgi:hypothetical protein
MATGKYCLNHVSGLCCMVIAVFASYSVSSSCPSGDSVLRGKVPQSKAITIMDVLQQHTLNSRITPHGPDACIDSAAASGYLNQPEVMEAIHVEDPGFCWSVCGSQKGWSYTSTRTNLPANTYPELVGDMRVVIFNGDWDACKFLIISLQVLLLGFLFMVRTVQAFHTLMARHGLREWASSRPSLGTRGPTPPPWATRTKWLAMPPSMMSVVSALALAPSSSSP